MDCNKVVPLLSLCEWESIEYEMDVSLLYITPLEAAQTSCNLYTSYVSKISKISSFHYIERYFFINM